MQPLASRCLQRWGLVDPESVFDERWWLTVDDGGVLDVADGRRVHNVPHNEALDGLVLGDHHPRGLAPHPAHLCGAPRFTASPVGCTFLRERVQGIERWQGSVYDTAATLERNCCMTCNIAQYICQLLDTLTCICSDDWASYTFSHLVIHH